MVESGRDFYAAPRVGPDGRLAFLAWDHPLLPFIGCELWVDGDAGRRRRRRVDLPARVGPGRRAVLGLGPRRLVEPLPRRRAADARSRRSSAARSGSSACGRTPSSTTVASPARSSSAGIHSFARARPADRRARAARPSVHGVDAVRHGARNAVRRPRGDADRDGRHPRRRRARPAPTRRSPRVDDAEIDPASISVGRAIEFESNGRTAHAFYYPPANADFEAPGRTRGRRCAS